MSAETMTRPLLIILSLLSAGSAFGESVFLTTRLDPSETIGRDPGVLQLDLQDFFQTYPSPGPVATLTIRKPVQEGWKLFTVDGEEAEFMSYKLAAGQSYDNPYIVSASEFEWTEHTVEYQLFGDEAPVTVANFKTYADDGAYTNTIVHRNESTGRLFAVNGPVTYTPLAIIQAGGFRIYDSDQYLLEWVPTRSPIAFEQTSDNVKGTIAMARTASLNSATSQFFINLDDNSAGFRFTDGSPAYTVFGELVDPERDQPVLDDFARTDTYDLKTAKPNNFPPPATFPNIFPTLPFEALPLYSPPLLPFSYRGLGYGNGYSDKSSYVRFTSVTVSDGDPSGITYSWEFADTDGEEGTSEEEAANQACFDIQLNGPIVTVKRSDTGVTAIDVTGTNAAGETSSSRITLISFNPDALEHFPSSFIYQGGLLENAWYGFLYADNFPWITHTNHGDQYVRPVTYKDPETGTYKNFTLYYDYKLASWLYINSAEYPNIYVYSLEKWVQYAEDTGDGAEIPRWFYVFDGDNSALVSEADL
jgi:cyclophilin family peptidyl-prolyl cis-trans isomerase